MKSFHAILFFTLIVLTITSCSSNKQPEVERFSFAFMTDIHLQEEANAPEGFQKAIADINAMQPDFVITGGDLIMDALGVPYGRADSLYKLYIDQVQALQMPVYNTMGNHEVFGIYPKSGTQEDHPEYGQKMFEKRLGETYYSFDHKGWHFMVLNSVVVTDSNEYIGMIDEAQIDWIRTDLLNIEAKTPIVISTHIPFITVFTQILFGEFAPEYHGLVVENARDVLDLFDAYNLKLVLQGHLHYLEYIEVYGTSFLTSGAVSGQWWEGPNHDVEEGFLMLYIEGNDFSWEYVDYCWEVE